MKSQYGHMLLGLEPRTTSLLLADCEVIPKTCTHPDVDCPGGAGTIKISFAVCYLNLMQIYISVQDAICAVAPE